MGSNYRGRRIGGEGKKASRRSCFEAASERCLAAGEEGRGEESRGGRGLEEALGRGRGAWGESVVRGQRGA